MASSGSQCRRCWRARFLLTPARRCSGAANGSSAITSIRRFPPGSSSSSVEFLGVSRFAVFLVPQACVLAGFAAVWWLARRLTSAAGAFLAVALLELVFAFTYKSLRYSANMALLPFWAWTIAFTWAALENPRMSSWLRLGVAVGLGTLAKYTILILVAAIALYCVLTPGRRWVFRHPGPWIGLGAALAVVSPHLYWLFEVSAQPLTYAAQSKATASVLAALAHAAIFIAHQLATHLPLAAVVAAWALAAGRLRLGATEDRPDAATPRRAEAVRFLAFVVVGPTVLTVLGALATAQNAPTEWGYPFPIASGLLVVLLCPWLARDVRGRRGASCCMSAVHALGRRIGVGAAYPDPARRIRRQGSLSSRLRWAGAWTARRRVLAGAPGNPARLSSEPFRIAAGSRAGQQCRVVQPLSAERLPCRRPTAGALDRCRRLSIEGRDACVASADRRWPAIRRPMRRGDGSPRTADALFRLRTHLLPRGTARAVTDRAIELPVDVSDHDGGRHRASRGNSSVRG